MNIGCVFSIFAIVVGICLFLVGCLFMILNYYNVAKKIIVFSSKYFAILSCVSVILGVIGMSLSCIDIFITI